MTGCCCGLSMSLSGTEIILQKGETLYRQGEPNDSAFIVASGEILLYRHVNGKRFDCERRRAGCILGETSILTGDTRVVSVEALEETRLYRISAEEILQKFNDLGPIVRACVDTTIDFVGRFNAPQVGDTSASNLRIVENNLSNAHELIECFQFEQDIIRGLKQGQFHMLYQPIVDLSDGGIRGFEALMRWRHPKRGFVPPDQFIHVAEDVGLIGQLTEFALLEATEALARLSELGEGTLFASINVSGQDVDRAGFVDFLEHALDRNDLLPDQVKLEVTETALVPDSEQAAQNLEQLRRLGCGISIDDFGTGYSNLGYLKALPLTALKIDRSFAGDAVSNTVSRSIVRMLVGLGHDLGVDVIAEGLETEEDVDMLRACGCQLAQGYVFHRPMPFAQLKALLVGDSNGAKIVA